MGEVGVATFNLLTQPWLPVRDVDRTDAGREISVREALAQAHHVQLAAELPTMQISLLRLLLAVVCRAVDGPRSPADVRALWEAPTLPMGRVDRYLDAQRDRFDLLHQQTPFMQVAGLTPNTRAGAHKTPAVLRPERSSSPMTSQDLDRPMTFAEAARWLVHVHAYDPAGIKTGMVDDPRGSTGRVTAPGPGWLGWGTAVWPQGRTLRETVLLNLLPRTAHQIHTDLPVWERPPDGPATTGRAPTGPLDLYTWQSRRTWLVERDSLIIGALLGMGDPLHPADVDEQHEPHFAWRRSPAQERKRKRDVVTMPIRIDDWPLWTVVERLLSSAGTDMSPAPALTWLPADLAARARSVASAHVSYGNMMAVIDDLRGDTLPGTALTTPREAVTASTALVAATDAYARLAGNLARAAGGGQRVAAGCAREMMFFALTQAARAALVGDPSWRNDARRIVTTHADQLMDSVPPSAFRGRVINDTLITAARSHAWFRKDVRDALDTIESDEEATVPTPTSAATDNATASTPAPASSRELPRVVCEPAVTVQEYDLHDPMALLSTPEATTTQPGASDTSRWRYGARDGEARQAKNATDRTYRRQLADAEFPWADREYLLALLTSTPDVVKAAQQLGITHQAIYARMRWDTDFAERVEKTLRNHCLALTSDTCGSDTGYKHGGRCAACRTAHRRSPAQ
jgi:CRISPR system Cascade subunit CasA